MDIDTWLAQQETNPDQGLETLDTSAPVEPEPTPTSDPEPQAEPQADPTPEPEPTPEPQAEPAPEPAATPDKPVQTPEENARFAEMRREQQLQARVQAELERLKRESPEYQLMQMLQQQHGIPAEEILRQAKEAQLQRESQERNVPIEMLRQRQEMENRMQQLEQQLQQQRVTQFQTRIEAEAKDLQQSFPNLTQDQLTGAVNAMLNEYRNPDIPLREVVMAKYGTELLAGQREALRNEILAELAGRTGTAPIPPAGTKSTPSASPVAGLTPEELVMANNLGISAEDYAKYK